MNDLNISFPEKQNEKKNNKKRIPQNEPKKLKLLQVVKLNIKLIFN